MSKIIAIWGSPNSGKTSFAVKLATSIYERYQTTILVLHGDIQSPALPVLFPTYKNDDMHSVGKILSQTDIDQETVLQSIVTVRNKNNLGFLGYMDGENQYTYPAYDERKVISFLTVLKTLAEYIVIDCTSSLCDILSSTAVQQADTVIRLATPDLKCMSFYASQLPLYGDAKYRLEDQILGLTVKEKDLYLPIEEAKQHFQDIRFVLPYCHEIKKQMLNGKLLEHISDKQYTKTLNAVADKVL